METLEKGMEYIQHKVNNEVTRTTPLTSFCNFIVKFTPFSSDSIVYFQQVND